jgi:Tol biopolymer transport system component
MVTDTYPDEQRRQHLFIMDLESSRAARVASFHAPPQYKGDWRCDLHPRWSRDSRRICIDSTHAGVRQVYVIELAVPAH